MTTQAHSLTIILETFDLISSTTILGTLYGIVFTLYCFCARTLYLQPDNRKQAVSTLSCISFLLLCATGYLAVNARIIQLVYIEHADYPGAPLNYEASIDSTKEQYNILAGVFDLVLQTLTMAVQVSH